MKLQEWANDHVCLTDPVTRYVLMACKRRDVPITAVFMSEVAVVEADNNQENSNNAVSWALYFGFIPTCLMEDKK